MLYDPSKYIVVPKLDLRPFSSDIIIITDPTSLLQHFNNCPHPVHVILLFHAWTSDYVSAFLEHFITPNQQISGAWIFCVDGTNGRFAQCLTGKIRQSDSVTSQTVLKIRQICAEINDLNIRYYLNQQDLYSVNDENSLMNRAITEVRRLSELQMQHNQILERIMEEKVTY